MKPALLSVLPAQPGGNELDPSSDIALGRAINLNITCTAMPRLAGAGKWETRLAQLAERMQIIEDIALGRAINLNIT